MNVIRVIGRAAAEKRAHAIHGGRAVKRLVIDERHRVAFERGDALESRPDVRWLQTLHLDAGRVDLVASATASMRVARGRLPGEAHATRLCLRLKPGWR